MRDQPKTTPQLPAGEEDEIPRGQLTLCQGGILNAYIQLLITLYTIITLTLTQ